MATPSLILPPTTAYRRLLKSTYAAVRYARPAQPLLRDRIRRAFRDGSPHDYDPARVHNTIVFLQNAGRDTGMEHQVLRALVKVWWGEERFWRQRRDGAGGRGAGKGGGSGRKRGGGGNRGQDAREDAAVRAYDSFYECVRGLNHTLGLCIR